MSNKKKMVKLGGVDYVIAPVSFINGIRVSSMILKYLSQSISIFDMVMKKDEDNPMTVFKILGELNTITGTENFEKDLLVFVSSLIGDIDQETLAHLEALEVIEQLPEIIEQSKLSDVINKTLALAGLASSVKAEVEEIVK